MKFLKNHIDSLKPLDFNRKLKSGRYTKSGESSCYRGTTQSQAEGLLLVIYAWWWTV